MPRIYCTRHPSYSIYNLGTCYQFKGGVLDTDDAGAAFLRSRPEWGSLFTDTPPEDTPPNPQLWKVETPLVLPAVPYNPPQNPLDTPENRRLGWPHLSVPGSGYPRPTVARLGPSELARHELPGRATPPLSRATFAVAASPRPGTGNGPPATGHGAPAPPVQGPQRTGLGFLCGHCHRWVELHPGHPHRLRLYCGPVCRQRTYRRRRKRRETLALWESLQQNAWAGRPSISPPSEKSGAEALIRPPIAHAGKPHRPVNGVLGPGGPLVQVRLSSGLAARLKYVAQLEHKTLSELVERGMRRYLPSLTALWGKDYTANLPPLEPLPRRRRLDGTYVGDIELVPLHLPIVPDNDRHG
jgi:hypothetical protein